MCHYNSPGCYALSYPIHLLSLHFSSFPQTHHALPSLWYEGLFLYKHLSNLDLINVFILHNHPSDFIRENFPPLGREVLGQVLLFPHFLALNIFPFPTFSYTFIFVNFEALLSLPSSGSSEKVIGILICSNLHC